MLDESVDSWCMNNTKKLTTVFALGLMAALGSTALAEGNGDPRVQVVELLGDSGYPWIEFSGQGETLSLRREIADGSGGVGVELYAYHGQDWELIKRVFGQFFFNLIPFGISDDGTTIAETNFENVTLIEGRTTTEFSKYWNDTQSGVSDWSLQGEALSGDGQRVGVIGTPTEDYYSDALLWDGESRFINLSWDLPQEKRSYLVRGLSFDGAVAVFNANYLAPLNNIRSLSTERDVWVWEDGELTMVPPLWASYEVVMRAIEISGNGQAVIGSAEGIWYDGFGDQIPITDEVMDYHTIQGPALAWIWTQETGTVEIADLDRFEDIAVWDITDDASTVLGSGYSSDAGIRQFLWYSDDHGFVMIDDLFTKLGITIDADSYSFSHISSDGSKLLGVLNRDGQYSALIVTIPVRDGD